MAEIEYDATGKPIPDGKYILTCKVNPIDPDGSVSNEISTTVVLQFKDYYSFSYFPSAYEGPGAPIAICARHNDGHTEYYFLHNVLYMEMHPNTPEVVEALREHRCRTHQARHGYE